MIRRLLLLPLVAALVAVPALAGVPSPAGATHSWGNYHWARTANPFTLQVGDNVPAAWDGYLDRAIADWTASTALDLRKASGGTTPRQCRATSGRIEVCAERYGFNGWLGIAQIWASGDHITQAVAKMNDTYFNTSTYNTPAWRSLVMCQELAHDFGLGHQDENIDNPNLGTCMDYTSRPAGPPSNEHPNSHDFDQILTIYGHRDSTTTIGQASSGTARGRSGTAAEEGPNNPAEFGRPAGPRDNHGRPILFRRELPDGQTLFTHVFWIEPGNPGGPSGP